MSHGPVDGRPVATADDARPRSKPRHPMVASVRPWRGLGASRVPLLGHPEVALDFSSSFPSSLQSLFVLHNRSTAVATLQPRASHSFVPSSARACRLGRTPKPDLP